MTYRKSAPIRETCGETDRYQTPKTSYLNAKNAYLSLRNAYLRPNLTFFQIHNKTSYFLNFILSPLSFILERHVLSGYSPEMEAADF